MDSDVLKDFSDAMQSALECFGMIQGEAKYYKESLGKALDQLRSHGCQHCNHVHCDACQCGSKWIWDSDGCVD